MLEKVLLIDDDPDEEVLFKDALEGIAPLPVLYYAKNGQEALNQLDSGKLHPPQIIFSDINMPMMDGWQFLRKIKSSEAYCHIPVIIYSTSSSQKEVAHALELGAAYFFTKPSHYEQLKYKLQVIIEIFVPAIRSTYEIYRH